MAGMAGGEDKDAAAARNLEDLAPAHVDDLVEAKETQFVEDNPRPDFQDSVSYTHLTLPTTP